jgi:hypothetical protein
VTGLPVPLLYDDPAQLSYAPELMRAGCRYLAQHATTWLLTSPTDDTDLGTDVCGMYHAVDAPGFPTHTLFVRNRAETR